MDGKRSGPKKGNLEPSQSKGNNSTSVVSSMEQTRRQERAAKCGGQHQSTNLNSVVEATRILHRRQDMKSKSPGKRELKVNQAITSMEINDNSD